MGGRWLVLTGAVWLVSLLWWLVVPPGAWTQDAVLVLTPGPILSTTVAGLATPSGAAYDSAGNIYIADTRNHQVRRISATGAKMIFAGNGIEGYTGDNGPATSASLDSPLGVAVGADGRVYIADTRNHCIRRVTTDGTIQTVAGTGLPGFSGDTGQAIDAQLRSPSAVAVGSLGELYIADAGNQRIRRVALDGSIRTIAGNGREENFGDGGAALLAGLDSPSSIVFRASDRALIVADRLNSRIRVITPDGLINSLPVPAAPVRRAASVSVDAGGNLYIADTGNYRLRAVTANGSGVLLGSGEQGAPGASMAYNATPLGTLYGIAADAAGGVSFSDRDGQQMLHFALPQLSFGSTVVGQTSVAQTLALQNTGSDGLNITGISVPAPFALAASAGTCGTPPFMVSGKAQCTVGVVFAPTAVGAQGGLLSVATGGLPQRAMLSGTAIATGSLLGSTTVLRSGGSLSYVGTPVAFTAQVLAGGTAVPTGMVHLLDATVEIANTALDGTGTASFSTASLTAGQHSISAHYDGDARYAASASAAMQQSVVLAPDFTVTSAATSLSTTAGTVSSMNLVLQPINGTLNQPVTLTYGGLPAGASVASNAPTPLVLGSNAVTVTLSLTTPAGAAIHRLAAWLLLPVVGIPLARRRRRGHWTAVNRYVALTMFLVLSTAVLLLNGCGGGYLSGASVGAQSVAHTYPVTVTATTTGVTGSPLVHTATFALVVN